MYSKIKVDDILELHRGYDLPERERVDGDVPIISSSGYSGSHNQYKCSGENVVTGRYGTIGEVFYHVGNCWPLNTALYVSDYKGNYPRYIYYLLKYLLKLSIDGKDKSTVPGVDRNVIHQMMVPYCKEKEKQKKQISILEAIDKRIEINSKLNDNLQQMAKTIYDYWFTQFDFPDATGNPYQSSGGAMVWNDLLKHKIPEGWSVEPLEKVIFHINTGLNPRDNFVLGNGKIRYITVKNITSNGTLDYSGCDLIDEDARAKVHRRSDIKVGDILFASIAPLGRCFFISEPPVTWDINESVFSIRVNERITPEYLFSFLTSDHFVVSATNLSTGSIFKGIRINDLLNTLVVLPPEDVLLKYSAHLYKVMNLKAVLSRENAELIEQRDWLLPMLMNGQATVSD